jgi:16S rRNA (cytosine967-C5)-methyltransferase
VKPHATDLAPGATALAAATRGLAEILTRGCIAEEALTRAQAASGDQAAARAILLGTLRVFPRVITAIDWRLNSQGRPPQPWLRALLACAVHQLEYSRAPPHSVVNIAVDAARALGEPRAAGLVNAVLRRFLRERSGWLASLDRDPPAAAAHPRWLYESIDEAWPDDAASIFAAGNEAPPMTLRVDLSRGTRSASLEALSAAGIAAHESFLDSAIVLEDAVAVERIPGFDRGLLSVQDAGAQLAARLLAPQPGERILDACAAPGGKTGHLLELCPELDLVALDIDAARLNRVERNLERLGRKADLRRADLRDSSWWDGAPFDRVLVDAPCSGTGVIRRHPDIKLLRRRADIAGFARTQIELLEAALRVLRPGGLLLYSTCSILPAENAGVIAELLGRHPSLALAGFPEVPLPPSARQGGNGLQILPTPASASLANVTDGFHYVCLRTRDGRER